MTKRIHDDLSSADLEPSPALKALLSLAVPEPVHQLDDLVDADDVSAGHDSCGVCLNKEKLIYCPSCESVAYCSESHLSKDVPTHQQVCASLAHIQKLSAVEIDDQHEADLVSSILADHQVSN